MTPTENKPPLRLTIDRCANGYIVTFDAPGAITHHNQPRNQYVFKAAADLAHHLPELLAEPMVDQPTQ